MEQQVKAAIEKMVEKIDALLAEAGELKKAVNVMSKTIGEQPIYVLTEEDGKGRSKVEVRRDQFFGMPLARAVRKVLELKNEPLTVKDILEQLRSGGFDFQSVQWKESFQYKNLSITLRKNSADFIRVPSGGVNYYGLWEFYPEKEKTKKRKTSTKRGKSAGMEESSIANAESIEEIDNQESVETPGNGSDE